MLDRHRLRVCAATAHLHIRHDGCHATFVVPPVRRTSRPSHLPSVAPPVHSHLPSVAPPVRSLSHAQFQQRPSPSQAFNAHAGYADYWRTMPNTVNRGLSHQHAAANSCVSHALLVGSSTDVTQLSDSASASLPHARTTLSWPRHPAALKAVPVVDVRLLQRLGTRHEQQRVVPTLDTPSHAACAIPAPSRRLPAAPSAPAILDRRCRLRVHIVVAYLCIQHDHRHATHVAPHASVSHDTQFSPLPSLSQAFSAYAAYVDYCRAMPGTTNSHQHGASNSSPPALLFGSSTGASSSPSRRPRACCQLPAFFFPRSQVPPLHRSAERLRVDAAHEHDAFAAHVDAAALKVVLGPKPNRSALYKQANDYVARSKGPRGATCTKVLTA
ncbi:hypothetical protein EVG20_g2466 [Dentipellis fragilis]|uniref:Uncharacterized protein n=1 Tax=Dentipellis fragilis TaxID=205917 RepID=A0A4Y9Z9Q8_9AGAM|nr:hypothetical protein EVG20_g2466 [Dentipellis fragilis]